MGVAGMEKSVDWIVQELQRLAREIERAQHAADGAQNDITTHEKLCGLRYETITTKLTAVPKIYEKLDTIQQMLYIGVGAWLAVMGLGIVVGIIYTIFHFAKGV